MSTVIVIASGKSLSADLLALRLTLAGHRVLVGTDIQHRVHDLAVVDELPRPGLRDRLDLGPRFTSSARPREKAQWKREYNPYQRRHVPLAKTIRHR